jgi:hypothetical protein
VVLVVINDFDVVSIGIEPAETDSPLGVDTNAVLAEAVPGEFLEAIARRYLEVVEGCSSVKNSELAQGDV